MAIHQLITPPANTRIAIRMPTMYPTPIRAGDKFIPKYAYTLFPNKAAPSPIPAQSFNPPSLSLTTAPIMAPDSKYFTDLPPFSPVFNTSDVATPSGNCNFCRTIKAERRGMVNSTPSTPPQSAIMTVSQ